MEEERLKSSKAQASVEDLEAGQVLAFFDRPFEFFLFFWTTKIQKPQIIKTQNTTEKSTKQKQKQNKNKTTLTKQNKNHRFTTLSKRNPPPCTERLESELGAAAGGGTEAESGRGRGQVLRIGSAGAGGLRWGGGGGLAVWRF